MERGSLFVLKFVLGRKIQRVVRNLGKNEGFYRQSVRCGNGFRVKRMKFGIRNDGAEIKRPFSRFQVPRTIRFLPRVKVVTHD